ncbi:MAG: hypothetical protein HC916_03850, partial [Coleofasciculaceae cyanobacterium SM2_1_6]|nr:hypothetical protein [Coleofasciculaceae cyanobacterium SM2_1_6]
SQYSLVETDQTITFRSPGDRDLHKAAGQVQTRQGSPTQGNLAIETLRHLLAMVVRGQIILKIIAGKHEQRRDRGRVRW